MRRFERAKDMNARVLLRPMDFEGVGRVAMLADPQGAVFALFREAGKVAMADDQEVVIVRRRGRGDVALLPADELAALMETAHLLRSPANAKRLLTSLQRTERRKGKPSTVEQLRREIGLGAAK